MSLNQTNAEFDYKDLLLTPLRGTILLTLLGLAGLYLLGYAGGLFGVWLRIVTVFAAVRYAQIVVEKLAWGYSEPPPLSPHDFNIFYNFGAMGFYVLLAVFLVLGNVIYTYLGLAATWLYSGLVAFALPALLATTVLENSITSAFNPVRIGKIIAAIGPRYAGVFAVVAIGYIASSTVAELVGWPFLTVIAGLYGMFLLSSAVGRLMFAFRHELGLEITSPQERIEQQNVEQERTEDANALQIAHQTARSAPKEAALELWRHHERTPTTPSRRLACFTALRHWPEPTTALWFAQPLTQSLIAAEKHDDAMDVVRWCLGKETSFRLADADTTYTLGTFAQRAGQSKLAAAIMQDMGTRYPDYQNSISGLFKVGTIAVEKLNHAGLLQSVIRQLVKLGVAEDDQRLVTLQQNLDALKSRDVGAASSRD